MAVPVELPESVRIGQTRSTTPPDPYAAEEGRDDAQRDAEREAHAPHGAHQWQQDRGVDSRHSCVACRRKQIWASEVAGGARAV
jgi:hypothetical protein